jgi:hypothetical protein
LDLVAQQVGDLAGAIGARPADRPRYGESRVGFGHPER